jgi:hypothetical protein
MVGNLARKAKDIGLMTHLNHRSRPKAEKFPVIFPLGREFVVATGAIRTASSAGQLLRRNLSVTR